MTLRKKNKSLNESFLKRFTTFYLCLVRFCSALAGSWAGFSILLKLNFYEKSIYYYLQFYTYLRERHSFIVRFVPILRFFVVS